VRAVVFDLWETLVDWPRGESERLRRSWSERLGVTLEALDRHWYDSAVSRLRETGPLAPAVRELCTAVGSSVDAEELIASRSDLTRRALIPRAGVLETFAGLRRRGVRVGLITNCTEDVVRVWPETALATGIDAAVFSCSAGCVKPEPRIYELVCEQLGVRPHECLFVGDGANDELGGAARVGMTAVLIHRFGEEPTWEGLAGWPGPRITAVAEALELVE
jgi:putative hydrolase of the HAD superfamily